MMSFWSGLAEVVGGIAFVFLPGAVIAYLTRRDLRYEIGSLLWGAGLMLVSLFVAFLISTQSLKLAYGENRPPLVEAFVSLFMVSLFVLGGISFILRFRNVSDNKLLDEGFMIGLGAGFVYKVFEGVGMMVDGFLIMISGEEGVRSANMQVQDLSTLVPGLLAFVVYRLAFVAGMAALGVLVARSRLEEKPLWLWLAIALGALSSWSYAAITQLLGPDTITSNIVVILYQGALAAVALWWLRRQMMSRPATTRPIKQSDMNAALSAEKASKTKSKA